ncbi:GAF domain-containing protein [Patescibacteria group bacterium]
MKTKVNSENVQGRVAPEDRSFILESIMRVNRAIQEAEDIEHMTRDVLDLTLEILECDRAWLLYPNEPDTKTWGVPMERSVSEWPGLGVTPDQRVPLSPGVKKVFEDTTNLKDVVAYDSITEYEIPQDVAENYDVKAQMIIAIYPKIGKAWSFGVHQCSHARIWSERDKSIMREIGFLIAGSLNNLLLLEDLQKTKKELTEKVEDLETANDLMVGRELKMVELKKELESKLEEAASGDEK